MKHSFFGKKEQKTFSTLGWCVGGDVDTMAVVARHM